MSSSRGCRAASDCWRVARAARCFRRLMPRAPSPGRPVREKRGRPPRYREAPQVLAVVRALILTGARIDELLKLEWEQIRREEMELHLPDTKTGFSRRPISPEALAVFDGIDR